MLVWNEKYSVNIAEIDDQHKKLIGMLSNLNDAMREGKGRQRLDTVLKEMIHYTQTHFEAEERLMQDHGFEGYDEHKAKHDKMTQKVLDIHRQYQEGRITITIEVMKFLQDWVEKHILGTDMKYAPFLNGRGLC